MTTNNRNTKDLNNFLQNLEILLERLGQPRTWLADSIGLSYSTVNNWWMRNSYPGVDTACSIARLLGTSVEALVNGDGNSITPNKRGYKEVLDKELVRLAQSLTADEVASIKGIIRAIIDFKRNVR